MSNIERITLTTGDFARADRAGPSAQSGAQPTAELKVVPNPLYNYSSYMYNFTLAAVRKSAANNPAAYMKGDLDLVILKTGGKGTKGLTPVNTDLIAEAEKNYQAESIDRAATVDTIARAKNKLDAAKTAPDIISKFNTDSPGRFDMFIDNVEIDTIMAFTEATGASLANSIKFDVIEPYSINGFLEALHFSAVAAGYLNYMQASYVLKLEFKGYPAGVSTPPAEVVPKSIRYLLLKFTGLDVEVTERGTRYKCKTIPYNEQVLGLTNTIKTPISMKGKTVKEILNNLCDNLNDQLVNSDKKAKAENRVANKSDKYFIKFPTRNKDGTLDYNKDNKIANTSLSDIALSNGETLYSFTKPGNGSSAYRIVGEKVQGKGNVESSLMQVQYRENAKIHEIISSVIRDSEYLRKTLRNINGAIDGYGYFDFFIIKTEVENQSEIDTVSRKPFQNFTYVVLPYKAHYTRIPGYSPQMFDSNKFKNIILKEYNYIYTGKNNDVINFKLNFNSLYFEAYPRAMGNSDQPDARFSDSKDQKDDLIINSDKAGSISSVIIGTPMHRVSDLPTSVQQLGGNASQPSVDPYQAVARTMYNAIINSQVSLTTGEIEIIGDPFYLIQGGIGNFNPVQSEKSDRMNEEGDANHLLGEVLLQIRFKNPVGIQSLEEGGMAAFDKNDAPFAGIYRVNTVKSIFSDGIFRQRLNITRLLGQTTDKVEPTKPEEKFSTRQSAGGSVAQGDDSTAVFDQQDAEIGAAMTEAQRLAMIEEVITAETQAVEIQEAQAAQAAAQQAAAIAIAAEDAAVALAVAGQTAAVKKTQEALTVLTESLAKPQQTLAELNRLAALGNFEPVEIDGFVIDRINIKYWQQKTQNQVSSTINKIQELQTGLDNLSNPIVLTPLPSLVTPTPPVGPGDALSPDTPGPLYGDEALDAFNQNLVRNPSLQQPGETAGDFEIRVRREQTLNRIREQATNALGNIVVREIPTNIVGPNFTPPPPTQGEFRTVVGPDLFRFDSQGRRIDTWVYPNETEAQKALEEARKLK